MFVVWTLYRPRRSRRLAWVACAAAANITRRAYLPTLKKTALRSKPSWMQDHLQPEALLLSVLLTAAVLASAAKVTPIKPAITTPREALGFNIGDDYQMATYSQLETYWKKLASESDRMKLVTIGQTAEGRPQYMAILSSPENLRRLTQWRDISSRLAHAQGLTDEQAHELAHSGKAVIWIDGGLHANETVGSQQLMEHVYQMVTRSDPETMRFLNDTIQLCVQANPDGQELVANWYMRDSDPHKRKLEYLPRLFQHYIGHDNNRDFYMSNMPETTNMNRQMFLEWFPQIVYNHHQTGPAGAVIFMPPFRDPFNYTFDPLIPLSVEAVGTAMHERLVAEGKGGSAQRTGANYSTWWNGGLRTITYFHNMIGLLTEIIGSPTPIEIPLIPDKQLPTGDWPLPIAPQTWHYRQSIDYDVTNNRAILDYASRNRETLLYNLYVMGRNSIRNGSEDHWTVTPDRIDALRAADPNASRNGLPADLYAKILHDPAHRDARAYIISADQPDFHTRQVCQCPFESRHRRRTRRVSVSGEREELSRGLASCFSRAGLPSARARYVRAAAPSERLRISGRPAHSALRQRRLDGRPADGCSVRPLADTG